MTLHRPHRDSQSDAHQVYMVSDAWGGGFMSKVGYVLLFHFFLQVFKVNASAYIEVLTW